MFQPNNSEPEANDASKVPPARNSASRPHQERLRHVLYGSIDAINRTIKTLHVLNYADPGDWSDPLPVPPTAVEGSLSAVEARQWMVIMTKIMLIE
jgi:hypothetical protein